MTRTPPHLKQKIYQTTVLLKLDYYCCAVWDPRQSTLKEQLEKVQKFAGRVITKNWSPSYQPISSLQTLATRRRQQKLKLCYKFLTGHSCITPPASQHTPIHLLVVHTTFNSTSPMCPQLHSSPLFSLTLPASGTPFPKTSSLPQPQQLSKL